MALTDELDKIPVLELANDLHFRYVFLDPFLIPCLEPLENFFTATSTFKQPR